MASAIVEEQQRLSVEEWGVIRDAVMCGLYGYRNHEVVTEDRKALKALGVALPQEIRSREPYGGEDALGRLHWALMLVHDEMDGAVDREAREKVLREISERGDR